MVAERVEKSVHDLLRPAHPSCNRLTQRAAAIRRAMVDAIPTSLSRRAWLPRERQPEPPLGQCRQSDYALCDRSGEPTVFIQTTGTKFWMDSANGWEKSDGGELAQRHRHPWQKPSHTVAVTCPRPTNASTIPAFPSSTGRTNEPDIINHITHPAASRPQIPHCQFQQSITNGPRPERNPK